MVNPNIPWTKEIVKEEALQVPQTFLSVITDRNVCGT